MSRSCDPVRVGGRSCDPTVSGMGEACIITRLGYSQNRFGKATGYSHQSSQRRKPVSL